MTAYDEVMVSLGLEPSTDSPGPCGTHRGYARHRYHGEGPCRPCRDANRIYKRERARAAKDAKKLQPIAHGTGNGARQHWYRGEKPCADCKTAYNDENRPRWSRYDQTKRNRLAA
jgi:hypothetical protein